MRNFVIILLALICITCQTSTNPESTSAAEATASTSCQMAVHFLIDNSGSMGSSVTLADGTTSIIMDQLKAATTGLIQNAPADSWYVGFSTFQDQSTMLRWGVNILTNANRASLIDQINGLTPTGSSDINTALWSVLGWYSADIYDDIPKYLIIISDGGVCMTAGVGPGGAYPGNCDNLYAAATGMRSLGFNIVTVGYNLASPYLEVMSNMASTTSDGASLAYNVTSPEQLTTLFSTTFADLCSFLNVSISVSQSNFTLSEDGSSSFGYTITRNSGDLPPLRVVVTGSFLSTGGTVQLDPGEIMLDAAHTSVSLKGVVKAGNSAMDGEFVATIKVVETGGTTALASRNLTIKIPGFTFTGTFASAPTYTAANETVSTQFNFDYSTSVERNVTFNTFVRRQGTVSYDLHGFIPSWQPSVTLGPPSGSGPFPVSFKRDDNSVTGTFEIVIVVQGSGLPQKEFVSQPFTIP